MTTKQNAPQTNHVTLFSNGIGHFRRVYTVNPGQSSKLSIPFKRDHVGDVLASLSVFGNVKYDSPPSFTPVNSNATALAVNTGNALRGLLTSLVGAQVTLTLYGENEKKTGVLLGTEQNNVAAHGGVSQIDHVVLNDEGTITKYVLASVVNVSFDEDSVKSEINKALKNAFQKIKPDSTFLDLSLSVLDLEGTESAPEQAVVQYTVPVAAWKMRYNIRVDGDTTVLEGTAIIDNNTDEDWDNFFVSVVTGNPISFSTDLAQVKVPSRSHVNLVETKAAGNVHMEEGLEACYAGPQLACAESLGGSARGLSNMARAKGVTRAMAGNYQTASYANFGMEAADGAVADMGALAVSPGVDAKEVGDFCIFTSKTPITILSKRSAVVPMFTVPLTKSGAVLIYKESDHARRPWRAIKFKNESTYSLGRGKVVVYQDGVFSGECVLEAAKPGDNRMLAHCLENGVKVTKTPKPSEQKLVSVKLTDGLVYQETVFNTANVYDVDNKTDEARKFLIEHVQTYGEGAELSSEGVDVVEVEKVPTANSVRLYFDVPANSKITLTVREKLVQSQSFGLNADWLNRTFVVVNHPIGAMAELEPILSLQKQIEDVQTAIDDFDNRREELTEQADRTRKNLAATANEAASTIRGEWVADLDATEKEIRNIDKVLIPAENIKLRNLQKQLRDAEKALTVAWKA